MNGSFSGFRPLYELAAKQNARLVAPWIGVITLLSVSSFLAYKWVFPGLDQRQALAGSIASNPAFNLIFGEPHNLLTSDGFNAWRSLALCCFASALMAIFVVIRETRAKEDSGQAELVGASVVGHHTQLAVAVAVAVASSVMVGIVQYIALRILGGKPDSSLMLALCYTASGIMGAGMAAITCQLASYAETASSMAVTVLGLFFVIRGYAETSPSLTWAVWLSPLGWLQKVGPAGANDPRPLLLCLAFFIITVAIGNVLLSGRDFGQGILPARAGAARAGWVGSLFGLALRIQGQSVRLWTFSFLLLGSIFGVLVSSLGDVFTKSAALANLIAAGGQTFDPTFEFIATLLKVLGIIAAVYGVQIMMRAYAEETEYRVEPVLAGAVPRWKLYLSHVAIAMIGPAVSLLLSAAVISFITSLKGVEVSSADIMQQAVCEIPAVWALIGLSVALIGRRPAVRGLAWLAVVASFLLTILGPLLKLWTWVLAISPLWHVPDVSLPNQDWLQLVWLGLVVLLFLVGGFVGYARRDIGRA